MRLWALLQVVEGRSVATLSRALCHLLTAGLALPMPLRLQDAAARWALVNVRLRCGHPSADAARRSCLREVAQGLPVGWEVTGPECLHALAARSTACAHVGQAAGGLPLADVRVLGGLSSARGAAPQPGRELEQEEVRAS